MHEKNLKTGYLLDFYGDVLPERKRYVLDMYYNEDYSLSEIAEDIGISRQGVRDLIKKTEEELFFFEDRLGLSKKMELLDKIAYDLLILAEKQNASKDICDGIAELRKQIVQ